MDAADPNPWNLFLLAHGRVTDRVDRDLVDSCGISLAEYEVLAHLRQTPGHSMRMNELADLVRLSPSGLTRRFDTLVRRGWVLREPCPDDRRGVNARLTSEGEVACTSAQHVHDSGVRRYLFDHLNPQQLECLVDALRDVAAANAPVDSRRAQVAQGAPGL